MSRSFRDRYRSQCRTLDEDGQTLGEWSRRGVLTFLAFFGGPREGQRRSRNEEKSDECLHVDRMSMFLRMRLGEKISRIYLRYQNRQGNTSRAFSLSLVACWMMRGYVVFIRLVQRNMSCDVSLTC